MNAARLPLKEAAPFRVHNTNVEETVENILAELFTIEIPVVEKLLRTIAVYAFLLIGIRILGKRELGQWNPVDFLVLLLISNTVENAIIGEDHSLVGGLVGAGTLFVVNHVMVRLSFYSQKGRRVIEGTPDDLMRDGHVDDEALKKNQVTREELAAAARRADIENLAHVRRARLETDGDITFYRKEQHDAATIARHIEERLDRIERHILAGSRSPNAGGREN
jgi:uncharacterized membrane protein YcaP (DUF421 family)